MGLPGVCNGSGLQGEIVWSVTVGPLSLCSRTLGMPLGFARLILLGAGRGGGGGRTLWHGCMCTVHRVCGLAAVLLS